MDLSFNLAPSYRDLKDPTSRQNFEDTPGQIPKLILTLRLISTAAVPLKGLATVPGNSRDSSSRWS